MAAVIGGLGHTFRMENKECESLNILTSWRLDNINLLFYCSTLHVHSLIFFPTDSNPLTEAIEYTADVYKDIGTMHSDQVCSIHIMYVL